MNIPATKIYTKVTANLPVLKFIAKSHQSHRKFETMNAKSNEANIIELG